MSDEPTDGRRVWSHRYSEAERPEGLAETRQKVRASFNRILGAA